MMKYKVLLLLIIFFFTFSSRVDAAMCDKEHISQLKELAKQIEVNYEYIDNSNTEEEEFVVNRYAISVNLLSDDLYLKKDNTEYHYKDYENGLVRFSINSGTLKLLVYSKQCDMIKLRTINLTLPKFNSYSYRQECKELEEYDLDVCDPWYQGSLDEVSFYRIVNRYLDDGDIVSPNDGFFDKILKFLGSYYIYILACIALVVFVIVIIKVHRKRSVLE